MPRFLAMFSYNRVSEFEVFISLVKSLNPNPLNWDNRTILNFVRTQAAVNAWQLLAQHY